MFVSLFTIDTDPESYGVITGIVPDDQFIASSSLNQQSGPHQGRARVSQPGLFSGTGLIDKKKVIKNKK